MGNLSYAFSSILSKPRLLYFPRSSYDAAVKSGNINSAGLKVFIFLPNGDSSNPFDNLNLKMCHDQIKKELSSLSQPCFLVVGDEDIESFKEKWANATNQPYFWYDIIKAFFKGFFTKILAFFCCGFVDQEKQYKLSQSLSKEEDKSPRKNPVTFPESQSNNEDQRRNLFTFTNQEQELEKAVEKLYDYLDDSNEDESEDKKLDLNDSNEDESEDKKLEMRIKSLKVQSKKN